MILVEGAGHGLNLNEKPELQARLDEFFAKNLKMEGAAEKTPPAK